jgi:hypothetical protein
MKATTDTEEDREQMRIARKAGMLTSIFANGFTEDNCK